MTTREELKLGSDKSIIFDAHLDHDYELNVQVACDCYFDGYLTVEELNKLRDHIDAVLGDGRTHQ